ncbi:MAG TPA: Zn-dependent hydrolase [Gammaproteobacteria bacterium]|nr:Zn-dependent hydrolase [Gammaproteobacteria bacterium]
MRTAFQWTALLLSSTAALLVACNKTPDAASQAPAVNTSAAPAAVTTNGGTSYAAQHIGEYAQVKLDADLSKLDADQKQMLVKLIEAGQVIDGIFWQQAYGDKNGLLSNIKDPDTRLMVEYNYGPWDRLNGDHPFVAGIGKRPVGANFYPVDMSVNEFNKARLPGKDSLYTLIRRDAKGALTVVPYHLAYQDQLAHASDLLNQASALSSDPSFKKYLSLRAQSLLTDQYQESDFAWLDVRDNPVDVIIGPIETYEDGLFGYKASYECFVLLKDQEWSQKLLRFARFLPMLQQDLPVPPRYKKERPGNESDLGAYNAVYYAGDANAGAKTIADNLPNDEQVQLQKGTRRLQMENVIHAKFDKIMAPIADELIAPDQLSHVTFDAFFQNTMFHEVAHGLGIKNTVDGKGTVRKALKDYASSFEEGKADVLGLYLVEWLADKGELDKSRLMDNYVTFLAGIFRSVRFGASDAHGKANMVRFNFFSQMGAFSRDPATGKYRVDPDKMRAAVKALSVRLLTIQGDGDYAAAKKMTDEQGVIEPQLQADLARLNKDNIPVDVVFDQGLGTLGLAESPSPPESAAPSAATKQ